MVPRGRGVPDGRPGEDIGEAVVSVGVKTPGYKKC